MERYAGFWKRFFAVVIDDLLGYAFIVIPALLYKVYGKDIPVFLVLFSFILLIGGIVFVVYNSIYLIGKRGYSIGKDIEGVIVLDKNMQIIGFWRAFLRQISKILSQSLSGLGYLWMLGDDNKETWHDKIAGTRVYNRKYIEKGLDKPYFSEKVSTDERRSASRNFIPAFNIILIYCLFGFMVYLCLKVVPEYLQVFSDSGGPLPFITMVIIEFSFLIRRFPFLIILIAPWGCLFLILPKKRNIAIIITTTIASIFFIIILVINLAIRLPFSDVSKFLGISVGYKDLKEMIAKQKLIDSSFEFLMEKDKDTYSIGEEVKIKYKLENISGKRQLVNKLIVLDGEIKWCEFVKKEKVGRDIIRYEHNGVPQPKIEFSHLVWVNLKDKDEVWLEPDEYLQGELKFSSENFSPGVYEFSASYLTQGVKIIKDKNMPTSFSSKIEIEFVNKEGFSTAY